MDIGFVGLGKMGLNMVTRLSDGGHRVVVYDREPQRVREAASTGCVGAVSVEELVASLPTPRVVWVMVPAGQPTEEAIGLVAERLQSGDVVIDGGNTHFHDDIRRAERLQARGIRYIDVGTSGGVWGLKLGYCLMVGGATDSVKQLSSVFTTLAPDQGWAHVGGHGAGHYVKMVHNGIEYGMMQAYAEGFELLSKSRYDLNLGRVAEVWKHGSVIRSWLLELASDALAADPRLTGLKGYVEDSGEGRWMIAEALETNVPVPTLTAAIFTRFRSRQSDSFAERLLAALRRAFGGHAVAQADR